MAIKREYASMLILLMGICCQAGIGAPVGADQPVGADLFEAKVRPLLLHDCVPCHGAARQSGGLRLDTREGLLKGGGRGQVIAPGRPADNLLLRAVSYQEESLKMPPGGPLAPAQLAALRQWVEAGAPWPDGAKAKEPHEKPLWSLQSLRPSPPPSVRNRSWVSTPIDAFLLAKLEAQGMQPAPKADRHDLIRRLYFDMLGLPPAPQEIAAFQADRAPDAYARLVDRVLAAPQYGERWARYWLDLVRYADSNGYERDAEKPQSWRYRDYVIRAFNEDKPYNRFVTEQLAGDELPDRDENTVIATGLLRLGTWDDEPNDPLQYRYDRLDDLVHVTGSAFLGLTVRCARCHDHKFDPISQKDYYAFAGAFYAGYLDAGDPKLQGGPPPDRLGYPVLGFTDRGRDAPALRLLINGDPRREADSVAPGFLSAITQCSRTVSPPPPGAATTGRRLQLAQWLTDARHPLTARVFVNRIWQHHFGTGLVNTPNNFGSKGSPPSHPELLDWLAADFVQHGWKIKRIHRLILLSSAYQMATRHPKQEAYARVDALNVRLWKFPRRRLDADSMRDAMLQVSGSLNPAMGGRGFLPSVTKEALEGLSRKGAEWSPSTPDEQRRRSIYMFLKRALIPPLMTAFDFGDTTAPLEQRDVTTVAPQALAMMNNPFLKQQSEAFAQRVEREGGGDRIAQVRRAWSLAFGRNPSASELGNALRYLRTFPAAASAQTATPMQTGLALRLCADAGVRTDAEGRVLSWNDLSGRDRNAVAPTAQSAPRLVAQVLNGRPAVRFDGKGSFLTIAQPVLTSQQFSIFAVVNDRGGPSHREIFSNWNGTAGNIGSSVFFGTTGDADIRFTDYFAPAGSLIQRESCHILTGIAGANDVAVYQNRRETARTAALFPTRNLMAPYVIGQQGNIGGEYWNGDILELLVFDRALNDAERDAVWDTLGKRYGIAGRPRPADPALTSLCHVLLNSNEFIYVD